MTQDRNTPDMQALTNQWEIEKTRMALALLETEDHSDEATDRIIDEGRAKMQAVEETILATEPDDLSDHDFMFLLRLARLIIGDDQFTPEQEARAEAMLDLIDTTLCRRMGRARFAAMDAERAASTA
jgi:hypothetical protein